VSEEGVLLAIHSAASPALDALFLVSHWMGSLWSGGALVLGVALWLGLARERRQAWLWLGVGVFVLAVMVSLKLAVARPRPQLWPTLVRPEDFSFPSGHALSSAAFYPLLAWTLARRGVARRRPLLAAAAALSAFAGLGRLYLGVHWPTDVLAGWALGAAAAAVAIRILEAGPGGVTPRER
jgi:undecaprenyl-diphosphatase